MESALTDEQSPAKRRKEVGKNPKKIHEENNGQKNLTQATQAEEVVEGNEESKNSEVVAKQPSTSNKSRVYTDQCTVFISNLDLNVDNTLLPLPTLFFFCLCGND